MAYQALARRLKFLIESYSRHGAGHVVEVFRQERIRRAYARDPEPLPSVEKFTSAFSWSPAARAASEGNAPVSMSFPEAFYRAAAPRMLLTRANRKEFYLHLLHSLQSQESILDDAELIDAGRFTALGVSIDEPGGRPDWHRDYSSGRRWEPVPYNRITYLGGDGSDVKYVWELNRMYWIAWLGKAYWSTGAESWAGSFVRLFDDWHRANPINVGVNWAMPMEVAIRGFWLTIGFGMFHGARSIDQSWWTEYLRVLWGHGTYLERNLEYFSNLTNHYISNCFGMLVLGAFFPGNERAGRWLAEGRRRMIEELEHQVLPDGVHYERSICYHRLVLEMYLIALPLAERAGAPFPEEARRAVERMAEFTLAYTPRAGDIPQLGDSDDGVILRLRSDQDLYDHRDTLALAGALFGRADILAAAGGYSQAALLVAGSGPFESLHPAAGTGAEGSAPAASAIFRDGGFAMLRSGWLDVFADIGPIGLHGNNDALSFTLHGPNGQVVIDPGTYCYTRDAATRNELRSTAAHNAPMIDGREIAEFDGPWRVKRDRIDPRVEAWEPSRERTVLEGSHRAYAHLPGGVAVRRRWELAGDTLRLTDRIEGSGRHAASVRFTIPSPCRVLRLDARRAEVIDAGGARFLLTSDADLELREGWYSPGYGLAAPAIWIEIGREAEAPFEMGYIWELSATPG